MKRLAVLGHPVAHSRSPAMQNAALKALGLAGEWIYEDPIDVTPERFEAKVRQMTTEGFVGANVTIPHKEAALWLADERTPAAEAIGAANTLSFREGRIHADNTDAGGLIDALRGVPSSSRGVRALVLGAGGAARAAIFALAEEGAVVDVSGVDVWNRTSNRAEAAVAELGGRFEPAPDPGRYGLIINTTSVGLHGEDPFEPLPLDPELLGGRLVVDLVYGDGSGKLIEVARDNGATVIDGIEILVRQGARSLQLWTGCTPPLDVMDDAARAGLSR
jgi:shikimate dehydrogenase